MAVLLSFMKPVVLLLLLDFGPGKVLLVPVLVNLGVPDVGGSVHFDGFVRSRLNKLLKNLNCKNM